MDVIKQQVDALVDLVNDENFDAIDAWSPAPEVLNVPGGDGLTPLMVAAFRGNKDIARYLVERGADVNCPNDKGVLPIHYAALNGDIDMCEFLFMNGAELDAPIFEELSWVPLHCAAYSGQADAFEYLAGCGANVKIKDAEGRYPHEVAPRGTPAARLLEARIAPMLPPPSAGRV